MTQTLPIKQLQPNPFQPREQIKKEDIEELAQSIKSYGVLEPLVVAQTPAGYQIIAGERRWRAAQLAGLSEVPVHIKKTTPKGMLEMAIIENVQRLDLSALERAQAFQQLQRNFGYNVGEIATKIGKSNSYVSNTLRLIDLPDAISDGLIAGHITEGHARAMQGLDDESEMIEVYKIVLKEGGSVRRTERLVQLYKEKRAHAAQAETGNSQAIAPLDETILKKWENSLQRLLETKPQLVVSRSYRQTKVTITLKGSPAQTTPDLEKIMALAQPE